MTENTTTATTMTREQAEQVTSDIRTTGKALTTARTKFASAVKRAKDGNAWQVLGHASWTDYVATVFADLPGLGKADAEFLTAYMAGEGMSSRAVARVLGVSQSTAARMIRQAEAEGKVEADRTVEGTDGKAQTAKGKGKGRKAGASKAKAETGDKAEGPRLADLTSEQVGRVALDALQILSDRWYHDGDDAAAGALVDLLAMLDTHKITAAA